MKPPPCDAARTSPAEAREETAPAVKLKGFGVVVLGWFCCGAKAEAPILAPSAADVARADKASPAFPALSAVGLTGVVVLPDVAGATDAVPKLKSEAGEGLEAAEKAAPKLT